MNIHKIGISIAVMMLVLTTNTNMFASAICQKSNDFHRTYNDYTINFIVDNSKKNTFKLCLSYKTCIYNSKPTKLTKGVSVNWSNYKTAKVVEGQFWPASTIGASGAPNGRFTLKMTGDIKSNGCTIPKINDQISVPQ